MSSQGMQIVVLSILFKKGSQDFFLKWEKNMTAESMGKFENYVDFLFKIQGPPTPPPHIGF